MLSSISWMTCRQAVVRGRSVATSNTQLPSSRPVRVHPRSQAGHCFGPTTTAAQPQSVALPPVLSDVYRVEADARVSGSGRGGAPDDEEQEEVLRRVGLGTLAGEMLLVRLTLPLQDAPRFARLPRWREAESRAAVAAVRGALDAPGLLYYAVRFGQDHAPLHLAKHCAHTTAHGSMSCSCHRLMPAR